ncbi:MAG: copper amine oxidase N-terminal domain-containing protein [Clostridiaceae bacterium]|nr:copper amine oxidase N-terminal domain-containing protein [Clostridiaceae bacterium]
MSNGRVLVPLRGIFESLGFNISWNPDDQIVTATKDNVNITLEIGNNQATVNNETIELDAPATLVNGRALVPVRFIAESIEANVSWNGDFNTVTITTQE